MKIQSINISSSQQNKDKKIMNGNIAHSNSPISQQQKQNSLQNGQINKKQEKEQILQNDDNFQKQKQKQTSNQKQQSQERKLNYIYKYQADPLRVVLIGLTCAGKNIVAQILQKQYGLQIIRLSQNYQQTSKNVSNLCFNQYKGKKVFIMNKPNYNILRSLKKRNFINVILVEASPIKRYKNHLIKTGRKNCSEQLTQFLKNDDLMQDKQFQRCLEYVRVRIFNRQDFKFLQNQIKSKIQSIIKPFRPNWDQYFMKMADIARRRSNCMKSSVGAVIVNDQHRVVSTGYNGTARGLTSCYKGGCDRCNSNSNKSLDQCLCLHAEESAIIQVGIGRTKGCDLYTTLYPCFSCAKIIKQAGIARIFYLDQYDKQDSGKLFLESNFDPQTQIVQIKIDNIYY